MGFDIRDVPVATVAGVGSMNGLGKLPLADFSVAAQTFGIVNTLVAIFPALDDELSPPFSQVEKVWSPLLVWRPLFREQALPPATFLSLKKARQR